MLATQRKIVSVPVRGGEKQSIKITDPDMSADFARKLYDNDIDVVESFYVVLLDQALQVKHWALVGKGGVSATVADVRVICKHVVDAMASHVLLVHNHPSGVLKPSEPDKTMTNNVKEALKYFGCQIVDHVIVTESSYYSFKQENLL